jgi:hypothetical protein
MSEAAIVTQCEFLRLEATGRIKWASDLPELSEKFGGDQRARRARHMLRQFGGATSFAAPILSLRLLNFSYRDGVTAVCLRRPLPMIAVTSSADTQGRRPSRSPADYLLR